MGKFTEVHRAGARQGYVSTRQPEKSYNLDSRSLVRHLAENGWEAFLPGFWLPSGAVPSFQARCEMVVAYVGDQVLLTGATALHALGVLRETPEAVDVLLPARRWLQPRDGVCLRYTGNFEAVRTVGWAGLRVARAPRALADFASHVGVTALCRAIADAIRLRHCTLDQIRGELEARKRFPGRGRLRRALGELAGELNHSGYERLGRRLLREAGIAVPGRPGPVVHRDRPVAEVDIPFFEFCYGVEIDGPPHLLPEQAARDRARDRMLARTCGWAIDRYLWFELEDDPERFVHEVTARLRELKAGG